MRGRAFVLILCFWAALMVITPALIKLSATAKLNGEYYVVFSESDEVGGGVKNEKVLASLMSRKALVAAVPRRAPTPAPAPAPAASVKRHFWGQKLVSLRR